MQDVTLMILTCSYTNIPRGKVASRDLHGWLMAQSNIKKNKTANIGETPITKIQLNLQSEAHNLKIQPALINEKTKTSLKGNVAVLSRSAEIKFQHPANLTNHNP